MPAKIRTLSYGSLPKEWYSKAGHWSRKDSLLKDDCHRQSVSFFAWWDRIEKEEWVRVIEKASWREKEKPRDLGNTLKGTLILESKFDT